MQRWLNFVVMVTLAVMVGVSINANQQALEQARRQAYLDTHPEIASELADAILRGRLQEGMSPDQVAISWGEPDETLTPEGRPEVALWAYPKGMVWFEDGRLREWEAVRGRFETGADLVRRAAYVLTHELDARTATLIRKGTITTEMTPEQVRASWGEPDEVLPLMSETFGETTVWVYRQGEQRQVTITFQQDRVLDWSEVRSAQPQT